MASKNLVLRHNDVGTIKAIYYYISICTNLYFKKINYNTEIFSPCNICFYQTAKNKIPPTFPRYLEKNFTDLCQRKFPPTRYL